MTEPRTTTEAWTRRVAAWRASGERAEVFSERAGYAASTLRWWASKLKHEPPVAPTIQLARVLRTGTPVPARCASAAAIVLEVGRLDIRIAVAPGADRSTLAMVLDVLGVEAAR